jgi:hypothetical protein
VHVAFSTNQISLTARPAIPEEEPAAAAGAPRLKPVNAVAGAAWPVPTTAEAGARPNPPKAGFGALSPAAVADETTSVRARCPQVSLCLVSIHRLIAGSNPQLAGKAHIQESAALLSATPVDFDIAASLPAFGSFASAAVVPPAQVKITITTTSFTPHHDNTTARKSPPDASTS